jgi:hypothetical protein
MSFAASNNEISSSFEYIDRQDFVDDTKNLNSIIRLDVNYLRWISSYWLGGSLMYESWRASVSSQQSFLLGMPIKYWIKGPESKGIGFHVGSTPYIGKLYHFGSTPTVLGVKLGPGVTYHLANEVGVDTTLYYDYQRKGKHPSVTTGMKVGFNVFF